MRNGREVEHRIVEVQEQQFYCAVAGPVGGKPVLLLHGFPEMSYGWRHQIWALADAGLRVIAPDQRGYGYSGKPAGQAAYRLPLLAADVVGIASAFGHERFALVGHDWGGIVAWHLAAHHASSVQRLAILNAPRAEIFAGYLVRHPGQALQSAYVAAFQLPFLPEATLSALDYAVLARLMTGSSRPGTFSKAELAVYRTAWSQPGALTAMLNWYRALPLAMKASTTRLQMPTLVLWGDQDVALQPRLAEASAEICESVSIVHLAEAGHWLHHEQPAVVNEALVRFLAGQE